MTIIEAALYLPVDVYSSQIFLNMSHHAGTWDNC